MVRECGENDDKSVVLGMVMKNVGFEREKLDIGDTISENLKGHIL